MFVFIKKYTYLFFKGSRFKTWPISLVPVIMAGALAYKEQSVFDGFLFFCTALSILFIQISVNLFNDAGDGKEGLDSVEERLGPPRLIGSGLASFFEVQTMALISCCLACLFAIPLILKGGALIFSMGCVSLLASYFYTGSRYSLLKLGLSEISAVLFFGFFIVYGTYYLQTLNISVHLIYLSLQCGFWSLSFLLINHLRDEELDKKKGRKHFVTLYGKVNSVLLLCILQAFIYLFCFYWLNLGWKAGVFSFCASPLSAFMLYQWNRPYALPLASLAYILFGSVWVLGLLY